MQDQAYWFLKVNLQLQDLYTIENRQPEHQEILQTIKILKNHFPNVSIVKLIDILHTIYWQTTGTRVVPALYYDNVTQIKNEIKRKFHFINPLKQYKKEQQCKIKINLTIMKQQKNNKTYNDYEQFICNVLDNREVENVVTPKAYLVQNQTDRSMRPDSYLQKFALKQLVAKSFIEKGYGMSQFREFMNYSNTNEKQIEYKKYAGAISSVVTDGFRAMERFIQRNCALVPQTVQKTDFRILYAILFNLKELLTNLSLNDEFFNVYCLFLKSEFRLLERQVKVPAVSVYKAYQAIMKILSIRQKQVDPLRFDQREDMQQFHGSKIRMMERKPENLIPLDVEPGAVISRPNIPYVDSKQRKFKNWSSGREVEEQIRVIQWGPQTQDQLARLYIEHKQVPRIREIYKKKYGSSAFDSIGTLRSQLYKIIRKSLRRAQKLARVYFASLSQEVVALISLKQDERNVQNVLTSPEFVRARVCLCHMHLRKEKDFQLLKELACGLEEGLLARRAARSQNSIYF